jgi:hypothetical protein
MSDEPMGDEASSNWPIYVMRWIEYRDEIGTPRRAAFCRCYNADTGRFFAVDDPDYEHAE